MRFHCPSQFSFLAMALCAADFCCYSDIDKQKMMSILDADGSGTVYTGPSAEALLTVHQVEFDEWHEYLLSKKHEKGPKKVHQLAGIGYHCMTCAARSLDSSSTTWNKKHRNLLRRARLR